MSDLRSVIRRFRDRDVEEHAWLYIFGNGDDLTLNSEADLGVPENDDGPLGFHGRGLSITIDADTVERCIAWADDLAGEADDAAAADVIRYYIRFDAPPATLGAPDPPSNEEYLRELDRAFCDRLGPEDSSKKCRRDGCGRGAVKLSVLCRRHHFENIQGRPYPFED
jgi:hypothetical protein